MSLHSKYSIIQAHFSIFTKLADTHGHGRSRCSVCLYVLYVPTRPIRFEAYEDFYPTSLVWHFWLLWIFLCPCFPIGNDSNTKRARLLQKHFLCCCFCIPSVCCAPTGNPIVVAFTTTTSTMLNEKMVNYWWPKVDNLIDIIYYRNDFFMKRARWWYWFTVDTGTWLNSFQLPKSYILPTSSIGCLPNFGAVYPNI